MIAERALREVATTEELMEMIDYIEEARTNGMRKLNQRVAVSETNCYLIHCRRSLCLILTHYTGETMMLNHIRAERDRDR